MRKFQPIEYWFREQQHLITNHIVGNTLIAIFFTAIGISFILYAKHASNKPVAFWIGLCFFLCGLSRAAWVLCVWYDVFALSGIITTITGIACIPTAVFVVIALMNFHKVKQVREIEKEIAQVGEKMETLTNLKEESKIIEQKLNNQSGD